VKVIIHFYADNIQVYAGLDASKARSAVANLNNCLSDNQDWVAANFPKLDDKLELCSCLLLLSEWLCESVPIALRAVSTL